MVVPFQVKEYARVTVSRRSIGMMADNRAGRGVTGGAPYSARGWSYAMSSLGEECPGRSGFVQLLTG